MILKKVKFEEREKNIRLKYDSNFFPLVQNRMMNNRNCNFCHTIFNNFVCFVTQMGENNKSYEYHCSNLLNYFVTLMIFQKWRKKDRKRILCITNMQHELQQMFYSLISSFFFSSSLLFKMHQSVCTCCFKRHFILNCILLKWRMRKPNGPKENIKTDRFASNSNSHEIEKRNSVQHNIQCSNWVEKKNVIRPITY